MTRRDFASAAVATLATPTLAKAARTDNRSAGPINPARTRLIEAVKRGRAAMRRYAEAQRQFPSDDRYDETVSVALNSEFQAVDDALFDAFRATYNDLEPFRSQHPDEFRTSTEEYKFGDVVAMLALALGIED